MPRTLLARPAPDEQLTCLDLADIIDEAAQLMETNGRCVGDWWPDAGHQLYALGMPCCIAGGIGVAAGYDDAADISYSITGMDGLPAGQRPDPHPAFRAVMEWRQVATPERLFEWSDDAPVHVVIAGLRECAQQLRDAAPADLAVPA